MTIGQMKVERTLDQCAERLLKWGTEYVLITGTHENTAQVINTLFNQRGRVQNLSWERLPGSYHGSGCTLASALATMLACGMDVVEASKQAQEYTWHCLQRAFPPRYGSIDSRSLILGA